ncbi:unnamed protein product [Echinostoma caproni]|uniref:DNA-directed RNA polymerase n=1 Tax=Echinostoma caproni TaxID=27848 RepID=A0A183AWD8_9TREM|nr:unnamed protein product [Echinostoma caproni]
MVKCFINNEDMNLQQAKLEVHGEPIFLGRRVDSYRQREGVLKVREKMDCERYNYLSHVQCVGNANRDCDPE